MSSSKRKERRERGEEQIRMVWGNEEAEHVFIRGKGDFEKIEKRFEKIWREFERRVIV